MKNDLFTLYLKHDENFSTISKFSLCELILKILYFENKAMSYKEIASKLVEVVPGKVPQAKILEALTAISKKIEKDSKGKYKLQKKSREELENAVQKSVDLHHNVYVRYFSKVDIPEDVVIGWLKNTMVLFFEKYNFEWINVVTTHKTENKRLLYNIDEIIDKSLDTLDAKDSDKKWLSGQFKQFVFSDDVDADTLFWQYGLSAFSARLICASTFANQINIECLRDATFLLDTNVLMSLGLEKHQLHESLALLEKCFIQLGIKLEYLYITKEEYRRAMTHKREELKRVFEEYDENLLRMSDCPFIRTALYRQCKNALDIERMFEKIEEVPEYFNENLSITINEDRKLNEAIIKAQDDEKIQSEINIIYKKIKGRDKREPALIHDAGLIGAGIFMRNGNEKYTILTNDYVLKSYTAQNLKRDNITLAIGLDVVIGLLSILGGGIDNADTHFAPLFKNIIMSSMMPSQDAFKVEDLAFMLGAHLEIQKLASDKVAEIAKLVNQKLSAGEPEDEIRLFLRQQIEGIRLAENRNILELRNTTDQAIQQRDSAIEQKDVFVDNFREEERETERKRRGRIRRCLIVCFILIVCGVSVGEYFIITNQYALIAAESVSLILAGIGFFPFKKLTQKWYSNDDVSINDVVEAKIQKMLTKNKKKKFE